MATRQPPQHNDSLTRERKRADEGKAVSDHYGSTRNPDNGRGHDERGRYGRSVRDPGPAEPYDRDAPRKS